MLTRLLWAGVLLALAPAVSAAQTTGKVHFLDLDQVVSTQPLKGENYTLDATVRNDGLINYYILNTDYGRASAQSTAELEIRIAELNALVSLEKMKGTEVFKDSFVKGVKGTGEGLLELVKSPVETSKQIYEGTGQFFSNIGEAFVSDDPDQDNAFKVAVGYDVAKRQFAYEFGINPYTDYAPAAERLGEIAQVATAGGITPKAALTAVGGGVAMAANVSGTMRGMQLLVRDNPPAKLREINRAKLLALGVSETLADAYLNNYNYDPYEETLLVGELEVLKVKGVDTFLRRANMAKQKSTALYYRVIAQMLAAYHNQVDAAVALEETAGILNLVRQDGTRVILAPLDYVFWTTELEARVDAYEKALAKGGSAGSRELWVTGRFDTAAREAFAARGWKIVEEARGQLTK